MSSAYVGRFAPTPSGPLHAGSLVAALGSWLDAKAHQGRWLVRIEDVDGPRTDAGAAEHILRQLHTLGLTPDGPVTFQSQRTAAYERALSSLIAQGMAYPCACTRQQIQAVLSAQGAPTLRGQDTVYPGTCHQGLPAGQAARAWRFRTRTDPPTTWQDRRHGMQSQDVAKAVGDFVLRRADGPWGYQLAVVVDDAAQGVTHVVRGDDLLDNTARQLLLQRRLKVATPLYLHLPLVLDAQGDKLSKSNGAAPLVWQGATASARQPQVLASLQAAATVLDLPPWPAASTAPGASPNHADWLAWAVNAWRARYA